MTTESLEGTSMTIDASPTAGPPRSRFHFAMAVAMLALVVVGFARTFFLRPFFNTYDVAWYVLGHGVLMTLWFVGYVAQTAWVAQGRVGVHRRMGVLGGWIGLSAILSSCGVALGMVTLRRHAGRDVAAEVDRFADVVWTNMSSICVFAVFFGLALALRRRPAFHSRLMLLATMSLLGPALVRAWVFPSFEVWPGMDVNTLVFYYGCRAALPAAMVIHELRTTRRLHPVTLLGIPALFAGLTFIQTVVPKTELGRWLILLL